MHYKMNIVYWDKGYSQMLVKEIKLGDFTSELKAVNIAREILDNDYDTIWEKVIIKDNNGKKIARWENEINVV